MRQRSKSFHFDKISVSDSESEAEHETDENEDEEAGEEAGEEWSAEEKKELLENIKRNFKERNKTYIIPLKKLDWTKIATTRTANETQTYFMELLKKIRKIRSLTEILDDPITWYGDPQSRTGQQSVYSLWNKDNYDRVLAAAGSTSLVARARAAASLYATITPEEKARYYAMLPPKRPQIKPLSKRITAFNLYHKHRRENKSAFEIPPYPQVRQDWNNLSIKERIPFIREVFAIAKQTGEEPQITKFEQKILDTDESRPLSPQTSLEIFKSEIRGTLGKNMIDKSKKASVLYKKLPKKEMKKYEEKAKKMKEEYVDKFAQWVQSLPEERREFEIAGLQENCNKNSTHKTMKKVLLAKIASLPVKNESITSESANGSSTDINMSPIKQNKKKATHKKKIQKNNESMRTMSESEIKNEPDSELMSYLVPLISYSPDNTLSATKKKHKNAELGISQVANESAAEPKVKNKNSKSVKENEVPNQETPVKNKNSKSVKENEVPNQDSPKMSSKSKKNVPGKVIAKGKKNVPMTVIPTSSSSEDESPPMKTASRAKAPPFKKIKSEPLSSENESIVNKKAKFTPGEMPEFDYNTPFDFWKGNIYKGKKAAAESAYAKLSEKLKQKYAQKFQLKQNEYLIALKDYLIQLPAASLREISATKIIKTEKDDVVEASDDGESASESETESD